MGWRIFRVKGQGRSVPASLNAFSSVSPEFWADDDAGSTGQRVEQAEVYPHRASPRLRAARDQSPPPQSRQNHASWCVSPGFGWSDPPFSRTAWPRARFVRQGCPAADLLWLAVTP